MAARWCASRRDHPRVCGEKISKLVELTGIPGSPPRVRGKVTYRNAVRFGLGITPACAGKRQACTVHLTATWDHPRVRGEKIVRRRNGHIGVGSPPRARGKVCLGGLAVDLAGITPACAGKRAQTGW